MPYLDDNNPNLVIVSPMQEIIEYFLDDTNSYLGDSQILLR